MGIRRARLFAAPIVRDVIKAYFDKKARQSQAKPSNRVVSSLTCRQACFIVGGGSPAGPQAGSLTRGRRPVGPTSRPSKPDGVRRGRGRPPTSWSELLKALTSRFDHA